MQLREYQCQAVQSIYDYYAKNSGNGLITIAAGCGKSFVMAEFLRRTLADYPTTRIIVATFNKELIKQNHAELMALWPGAPAGILSAGLRSRNTQQQIIFAGIQTAYKMAFELQRCDILLVDEAQSIPHSQEGQWRRFIGDLLRINPKMKVIGLTATDFRLDSGLLYRGKDALFHAKIFDYGLLQAVKEGYLCEIVPAPTTTHLTTKGVTKRGGEFVAGELERAVDVDSTTRAAVAEIVRLGADRRSWLVFAAGVKHAEHIHDILREHGVDAEMVTGETLQKERDANLEKFKTFGFRAMVVVGIGTIGYNHPGLDLIACLRPTGSAGLWYQMACRGSRLFPGKVNCLLLDFSENGSRHGPLDQIKGHDPKEKGSGEMPQKICDGCHAYCWMGAKLCPDCGKAFEFRSIDDKLTASASNAAVLSTQIRPTELAVKSWELYHHDKSGKPVSLRVGYRTGVTVQNEYWCFQHTGYARNRAVQLWAQHGGRLPPPATVSEAIARKAELNMPRAIVTRPSGKYTEIVGKVW